MRKGVNYGEPPTSFKLTLDLKLYSQHWKQSTATETRIPPRPLKPGQGIEQNAIVHYSLKAMKNFDNFCAESAVCL